MTLLHRTRRPRLLALAVALAAALTACGGSPTPPEPTGTVTVTGAIGLPAGHGIDVASLTVSTPLGIYPVSATGEFEADVFDGADTEVGVETAAGELLLLGVTNGDTVDVSLAATSEALLYYLVGGMWLPPAQQDTLRELLRGAPEADVLETELRRQLLAGGNGLSAPDQALIDALQSVHDALFADALITARLTTLWAEAAKTASVRPAAEGGGNIIIEPASTVIAGVEVIHNPAGSGVVAQNHFRRPAAILAYETGWEDAEGVLTEHDVPVPVATVDVPATGQLEFFQALLDVVTADSPWSPVVSEKVSLPDHAGASRTHFTLVAVGPSGTDATWPIMEDERFDIFHGHWENVENEKTLELFLDELLLPLVEVYGLGSMAKVDAAKLNDLRSKMRLIHDEHLAGLGILLSNRQRGLVDGMKYALKELAENKNFRLDLTDMIRAALAESDYNKFVFEGAEKRLSSRASASGIAAAVETLLVSGDVAMILNDLVSAPAVVDWTVVTAPALFVLVPEEARVTKADPSVRLTVVPKGEAAGTYLYRWTSSGHHGSVSDLSDEATSLTTTEPEIWYFHDDPAHIADSDVDTVTVEVFSVEAGVTDVAPGAQPIATMTATITGDSRELPAGLTLVHGVSEPEIDPDSEPWPCAAMYFRFPAFTGATWYDVTIEGMSVPGHHPANTNHDLASGRVNYDYGFDPDSFDVAPWVDGCSWRTWEGEITGPPGEVAAFYDADANEYVVHLFSLVESEYWLSIGKPTLGEAIDLWFDWMAGSEFTVIPEF